MENVARQARGARSGGNAVCKSGQVRHRIGSAVGERTSTKHTRTCIRIFVFHEARDHVPGVREHAP